MNTEYLTSRRKLRMNGGDSVVGIIMSVITLAVCIFSIAGTWKIYVKAGEHGWACIVPFYGNYVFFRIVTGNGWLFLLQFIPIFGTIFGLIANFKLGKLFGKSTGFCIGLTFLAPIFRAILGFGNSEFEW